MCVEKIAGENPEPIDYGNIPGCTYCNPEISSVGLTEAKAKEACYEIRVGKFPFTASGKASAAGHKDGFVKFFYVYSFYSDNGLSLDIPEEARTTFTTSRFKFLFIRKFYERPSDEIS